MIDVFVVFELNEGKYSEAHRQLREVGFRNSDVSGVPLPVNTVVGTWQGNENLHQIRDVFWTFLVSKALNPKRVLVIAFTTASWIVGSK